jgi:hypothetical protein
MTMSSNTEEEWSFSTAFHTIANAIYEALPEYSPWSVWIKDTDSDDENKAISKLVLESYLEKLRNHLTHDQSRKRTIATASAHDKLESFIWRLDMSRKEIRESLDQKTISDLDKFKKHDDDRSSQTTTNTSSSSSFQGQKDDDHQEEKNDNRIIHNICGRISMLARGLKWKSVERLVKSIQQHYGFT